MVSVEYCRTGLIMTVARIMSENPRVYQIVGTEVRLVMAVGRLIEDGRLIGGH